MTPTDYNPMAWNWGAIAAQAATFGLKLLGAIIILIVGYFVARLVAKAIDKILLKIGFDKIIERGGIKQAMTNTGYDAARLVSQIIFYALMIFVIAFALNVFGPNPISDIFSRFIAFFPNILVAIVILIAAAAIGSIVRDIVRGAIGGLSYGRAIATVSYVGILMLGLFMALSQLAIAPAIINGLWYAMLAIFVGVSVVAIGGGGIKPMEERWRRALDKADEELPRAVDHVSGQTQSYQSTGVGYQTASAPQMNPNQPGVVYPIQNPNNPGYRG